MLEPPSTSDTAKASIKEQLQAKGITECAFLDAAFLRILLPERMPEGIRGAALFLIPYYTGAYPERNVSLYSISKDYHLFSRSLATEVLPVLQGAFPGEQFHMFCDSSPIDEVRAALGAGLGVWGQNRLLIHPVYGSFVFIGSILTSIPFPDTEKELQRCIGCGRCKAECAFLRGEAAACTSELNQRKVLTEEELAFITSRPIRWGCDVCQEVCPMNRAVPPTPIDFFYEEPIPVLTKERLLSMTKSEFRARAYAWRGKTTILRNLR